MTDFVHLHLHTVYSLLDGATRIDALIKHAKELGQKAVAITDHGVMSGVAEFYRTAKEHGIKPVLGCEVYVAPRSLDDKTGAMDSEHAHLVLLAKNNIGYKNLMKIVSIGHTRGFYYKPRIDKSVLREYSEGIIALSACIVGEIPQAIIADDITRARALTQEYIDIFGKENFFLEIQDHGLEQQKKANIELKTIASEFEIGLVATNDVHYLKREDSEIQDILLCIQTGKTLNEENRMKFTGSEFYLKTGDEIASLFPDCPEALTNTVKIADMCDVELEFGKLHLPRFNPPNGQTPKEFLNKLCIEGAKSRYGSKFDDISDRLNFELTTIENMEYVDYFLIVHDFINYARSKGISVGPGRGSAAGSIVSYSLGITDVEPTRFGLLFERFLNPERVSMPDIDIDFCYQRRHEVIEYVVKKYGKEHVAQIATFGTLGARAAIRDVGRVMDIPYDEVDKIAKMVPMELNITLKTALDKSKDLRSSYENSPEIHTLLDRAIALEGVPRHVSTHAAGIVITEKELNEYVPLQMSDESIITQFPMGTLEELGLLKMDFLGLRTLTVIKDAVDMLGEDSTLDTNSFEDKRTYELIASGETNGIFQLESTGMKAFLRELKPTNFEDIIAAVALYRPGPMDSIPTYIKNKNNPELVTYKHPVLANILDVTYGCVVYQEQVMQIVRELGGYTLGQADILRRAMSKKKRDVMERERAKFIEGATNKGVETKVAESIFDDMMSFASYAFNKSHAAAYAVIAYQTAYLKAHHPCEFMAALLCSEIENTPKITKYIAETRAAGIEILPCSINESGANFTPINGKIRFGLVAVKGVGESIVCSILKERDKRGKFVNLDDFCKRMSLYDINKKSLEALIKSGAFDEFAKRSQLLAVCENVMTAVSKDKKQNLEGQFSLFDDIPNDTSSTPLPNISEFPKNVLLSMERESTGIFMSGNPLDEFDHIISKFANHSIDEIVAVSENESSSLKDGDIVSIAGAITSIKKKNTRNGAQMAFVDLQDRTGNIEVVIFPNTLAEHVNNIVRDTVICVQGRVSLKEDVPPSIVCNMLQPLTQDSINKIYIKLNDEKKMNDLKKVLKTFRGSTPVYIFNPSTSQTLMAPQDMWVNHCDALDKAIEDLGLEIKVRSEN